MQILIKANVKSDFWQEGDIKEHIYGIASDYLAEAVNVGYDIEVEEVTLVAFQNKLN